MNTKRILTYKDAVEEAGSEYLLKKRVDSGGLYRLREGLYSVQASVPEVVQLLYRYPNALYTGESAFYLYSLTDVIPDLYTLATPRSATRITASNVKQVFLSESIFSLGHTTLLYNGYELRIYDRERLLIELLRNKSRYPFDYYKEIVSNFRRIIHTLDIPKIYTYLESFRRNETYINRLESEIL